MSHSGFRRALACLALAPLFLACGDPEESPGGVGPTQCARVLDADLPAGGVLKNQSAACDVWVARSIKVTGGALEIEPGTVLRFAKDAKLDLGQGASLQAVGTPAAPIRFEAASVAVGFARGIFLGPQSLPSRIEHAQLVNLGQKDVGAFDFQSGAISGLQGGGLSLKHTTVRGSGHHGLEVDSMPLLAFESNTFEGIAHHPVRSSAENLRQLDAASDYAGLAAPNGLPSILVEGATQRAATTTGTWHKLSVPYFVERSLHIEDGHITIEAGARFEFGQRGVLRIKGPGTLAAVGTAAEPIVFTGAVQSPGHWDGLTFSRSNSPLNRLAHVRLDYGGGGGIYKALIALPIASSLTLEHSRVANSASWGMCVGTGSEATWEDTVFTANALGNVVDDC